MHSPHVHEHMVSTRATVSFLSSCHELSIKRHAHMHEHYSTYIQIQDFMAHDWQSMFEFFGIMMTRGPARWLLCRIVSNSISVIIFQLQLIKN